MRSPFKVTITGAPGVSPWIILDYVARTFNVGLFASLSEDATGTPTYSVEYTPDNPNETKGTKNPVASLTRTGTTATLTWTNPHGLVTGDAVKVWNSGDPNLDGDFNVASTPANNSITYTVGNTGATVGAYYVSAVPLRVFALAAAVTAATTRQSLDETTPALAVRLHVTQLTGGSVTLEGVQGLARG
jgi:hypothetical protein